MNSLRFALVSLLLTSPLVAQAGAFDAFDIYAVPDSGLEIDGPLGTIESEEGDAFGVRLLNSFGEHVFAAGQYQSSTYQGVGDPDLDQLRAGLGYSIGTLPVYVLAEYVRYELGLVNSNGDDNGFGVHLGGKFDLFKYFSVEARVGYLDVGDAGNGFEYVAGAALNLDANFSVFAEYQETRLNNDADQDVIVADIRTGLRFRF
ncbi:hypothetical protein E4T66_11935 [Sinimarinibacterium sp. CAU 1509]|uniref:outer membrane beta-barrel protein n=1 Tax=Sinimarinibacterium sp. CAU 1509 TaxID=2562283 RepID=UPI0010ABBACD|nr:outer membrane beta-barrel protein [Sinimarinibacterium sp. CAU 1509]TJY59886.1 hypothetical protein E4T66_11935 [Sinimarinibacterium sp. CAU 1509]